MRSSITKLSARSILRMAGGKPERLVGLIRFLSYLHCNDVARSLWNYSLVAYPRHELIASAGAAFPRITDFGNDGAFRSAEILLGIVAERYRFSSVVDFGAGRGSWLRAAHCRGASKLAGWEHPVCAAEPRFLEAQYTFRDLNESCVVQERYDLAICVEVAEHLNPARAEPLIDDICRASDAVIFSAALPRQLGDGHVNCRPHSYWISLFEQRNYSCLDVFRSQLWHNNEVDPWYRQNCFLFLSPKLVALFPGVAPVTMTSTYHPLTMFSCNREYIAADHRGTTK